MSPATLPVITRFDQLAWKEVQAHVSARIDQLREQLETPGLPEAQTEQTRGAIRELRALLKQQDAKPQIAPRHIYTNYEEKR